MEHEPVGNKHPPKQHQFTSENQPSNEAKSRGHLKSLRGAQLVQAVLKQMFKNKHKDKELEKIMKEAAAYFQLPEKELTMELMLVYGQAKKAVVEGHTPAFTALMDRGFGKPPQRMTFDIPPPAEPAEIRLPSGRVINI